MTRKATQTRRQKLLAPRLCLESLDDRIVPNAVITSDGGGSSAALNVAENTTAVTTVVATGVGPVTYSIVAGDESAKFAINATTGILTFINAPNFEAPTDADLNNSYVVTVEATDLQTSDLQTIAVSVTNVNDAPVITSNGGGATANISAPENGLAVTTVSASDDEGTALSYFVSGGADAAKFAINASTGVLTFVAAPDFETKADANADGIYEVQVLVGDGVGSDTQAISVTVTNVNEVPVITSNGGDSTASMSVAENSTAVTTVTASDVDAATTLQYSIVGGADAAKFSINGSTGALTFVAAPNFENKADANANGVYEVTVQASDGSLNDTQAISVTVNDVNEAPVITSNGSGPTAGISKGENGTSVTTVNASDVDAGASLGYSITGGADAAKFSINPSTGTLTFLTAPNFEAPTDTGADNTYLVTVQVSDGTLTDSQAITVSVTNVDEPLVMPPNQSVSVNEHSTAVTTVGATDPDGSSVITYSIFTGDDAAKFNINASTGVVTFKVAPNFEVPGDVGADNVYSVSVKATDQSGSTIETLTVTVVNINEPPSITSNGGGSAAVVSVAENSKAVTTVSAIDLDPNPTLTYSITGGADKTQFAINSTTGALSFLTAPNFENPTDSNLSNSYELIVEVSDGALTDSQAITVNVTNVDESLILVGGPSVTQNLAENQKSVRVLDATDPEGAAVTYSIIGGDDQALFAVDASTGALSFVVGPNFEVPTDINSDGTYAVTVQAADGTSSAIQAISVTITNVDEGPQITSPASASVAENTAVGVVLTVAATDPEADAITYSIVGGDDAGLFTIDGSTGKLTFNLVANFEDPADANDDNIYSVTVQAASSGGSNLQSISVSVTNADDPGNDAPYITSNGGGSSASISVAENSTAVTTVTATDPDAGAVLTYSLAGGADAGKFSINASTGVLIFLTAPNFEAPTDAGANNVYDVTVQVSDGTLTDSQAIAVSVTDLLNEAPVITSNGGGSSASISVAENSTAVTTVTATDPDAGAVLTYSLAGGADAGKFSINASTGVLTFLTAPNFEAPTDAGANNVYDVTVQVSDGTLTDTQSIAVAVTNTNEAPVNTVPAAPTISRNGKLYFTSPNAITVADVDAGSGLIRVTMSAPRGTFTLNSGAGLSSYTGNNTATMTITGTLANVNAALLKCRYNSPTGFTGTTNLTITTSDLGSSGTGGTKIDTDVIALRVVNHAPTTRTPLSSFTQYVTGFNATLNTTAASGVLRAYQDADGDVLKALLVTGPAQGSLTLRNDGSFTYVPVTGFRGSVTFTVRASDMINFGPNVTFTITVG